jgi:hypothetical protein
VRADCAGRARDSAWRRFAVAALAAAATACTTPQAGVPTGSHAAAEAPRVAVGESWTYRVHDGFTGLPRGTLRYRVSAVSAERITVSVTAEDGASEETRIFDRQWNWVRHPATNLQTFTYDPPYAAYAFPLVPGKTWRARTTATDPADGRRFPVLVEGAALGWERVRTPAGEFEAIKVRRVVYLRYWVQGVRDLTEILEYEWYAPAVGQAVRREASSRYLSYFGGGFLPGLRRASKEDDGGPHFVQDDWLIAELVSYEVH